VLLVIEHVLVMAAGRGQRMGNLTRTRPKALLPIMGRPMIVRVMDCFYEAGIRRFTVVVGEHEGGVAGWLSQKWHLDVSLKFVPQGFERGTAVALIAAQDVIDGPFILSACDNLISGQHARALREYFGRHPGDVAGLSVIYSPEDISESAAVILDPTGYAAYIAEKPGEGYQAEMTAMSVFAFMPRVLDYLSAVRLSKRGERELTSAIMAMIDGGEPVGHIKAEWRHHISYPRDLLEVNLHYLREERDANILSDLPKDIDVIPPVRVDPHVSVGRGSVIGPNVYLESGTVIGQDVCLKNAVVLGRTISAGQSITDEVVNENR
jgi:NDP-sugar pyrophosphorylase family protein